MFRFLDCGRKLEDLEETQHIKGPEPESDLDHPGTDPPISFSSNVHVWNSSWETSGNIYCLNFKFKVPLEPRTQTLFTLSLIITSFSSHRCCRLAKIIVCFGNEITDLDEGARGGLGRGVMETLWWDFVCAADSRNIWHIRNYLHCSRELKIICNSLSVGWVCMCVRVCARRLIWTYLYLYCISSWGWCYLDFPHMPTV